MDFSGGGGSSPWLMKKVIYTPKAKEDLLKIKEGIMENFGDEELAVRSMRKLTGRVKLLQDFPNMGAELEKVSGIPSEYHYLFCKPDYVFYRVEKETVRIIRVLHERQDYMRTLFGIAEIEDEE